MKFLIVEPSPLPIRIPLWPKYLPQHPVFKHPYYIRCNGTNYEVPHCKAFSTPYSHPNIRLRILPSNTLSLRSSLNERELVSQPYSTTGNIIVLYILMFKFLERSRENERVCTK